MAMFITPYAACIAFLFVYGISQAHGRKRIVCEEVDDFCEGCSLGKSFYYKGTRYWLLVHGSKKYFPGAQNECKINDGRPADIQSKAHYDEVMIRARGNMPENLNTMNIWTGMTVNPKAKLAKDYNGQIAKYTKWFDNRFPILPNSRFGIIIEVNRNLDADQGMWNNPRNYPTPAVLCQSNA